MLLGVLQARQENMIGDYAKGIRIAVIEVDWSRWEPADGTFDKSYINDIRLMIHNYHSNGYKIGIVSGLHHFPTWVLAKPNIQHKDQFGNQSGALNFQFSRDARFYGERFLTSVVRELGSLVYFHRVGFSKQGETLYPEAVGNASFPNGQQANNWWAFDTAAQTGAGIVAGIGASPMPGWIPGTATWNGSPVTTAMARSWYDWYFGALIKAVDWQVAVIRAAQFNGFIHYVSPGIGGLPDFHDTRINNLLAHDVNDTYYVMNTGAIWWRFYTEVADTKRCMLTISSIYDASGTPRGNVTQPGDDQLSLNEANVSNWSSARYLSSVARRRGMQCAGENVGSNQASDVASIIQTAQGCGLVELYWAFDDQLNSGDYATITQLSAFITDKPSRSRRLLTDVQFNKNIS